jgi:hypothetical protein
MIRCEQCRFWRERDDNPLGTCQLNPPTLILIDEAYQSVWPETQAADWCGKAEERQA